MNAAYGLRKFLGAHVFQQITGSARVERAAQVPSARKGGENNYPSGTTLPLYFSRSLKPRHFGHFNVSNKNVRLVMKDRLHCFFTIAGACNHRNVSFNLKQRCQRAQNHALIFGDHHTNRASTGLANSGIHWALLVFTAKGNWITNVVPCPVLRSKVPPSDSTLSRIPRMPLPSN